ncbi:hypothetical protein KUTeg_022770 [Tegillarca granosa]|uniref:Uncharacterized protein n=1 Tax=Tegillarca granosa TaxID=220873 RepID=A0ABQ9E5C6_TEGGR|nr:hypothetical protein KUTeg_022770 [Tegillarca granosa]
MFLVQRKTVPLSLIEEKWVDLALPKEQFDDLVRIGSFGGDTITDAMKTVCEILTADPEGGPARIPFPLFKDIYTYLAQIDGEISQQQINDVMQYLKYDVKNSFFPDKQDGYVQPRNFLSPECPKLSAS